MKYVIGIDQSTQGTKAMIFDERGKILGRVDHKHRQIINEMGWISHDADEIYDNVLKASRDVVAKTGINKNEIVTVGISNQRETTVGWDQNGVPVDKAIVWQCARAKEITDMLKDDADRILGTTGLPLSPYWPAGKMAWLMKNTVKDEVRHLGTVDSWLIFKLTEGKAFKCDYSNASRTQLFNLHTLKWDEDMCKIFGVPIDSLPEICDSNSVFGYTDLEGFLDKEIPISGVLGDSHGALFGQGCHQKGMIKTTYGTGSSIMMNVGKDFVASKNGLATSLAWGIDGKVSYVLEGNINYTGAVITWLQEDLGLLNSPKEIQAAIEQAKPEDTTVLIPAFSGLGAPHWNDGAKAMICGMTRSTGRNELIKAGEESIALQINDVIQTMRADSGIPIEMLCVDGGPTRDKYLMQFQSDISDVKIGVRQEEELSAMGAAYLAGITQGVFKSEELFGTIERTYYTPQMPEETREEKRAQWQNAIETCVYGASK